MMRFQSPLVYIWLLLPLCYNFCIYPVLMILKSLWVTVKAATVIFISGRGSAILSAKERKPGFIYNLVKELKSSCVGIL